MAGYVLAGDGGYTSTIVGGNMTPTMPATTAGWLLLMHTGANSISLTPPTISGWTSLSTNTNAKCDSVYAKIAVGGDVSPTFQWAASGQMFARILAFSGDVFTNLATIVDQHNDRGTNTTGKIAVNGTSAPSQDNCLAIRFGHCVKTSTNNGATFGDWSTDTGIYTKASNVQLVQSNNAMAAAFWYWQQTTATLTNGDLASLTNVDTSANTQGTTLLLLSQPALVAPPTSGGIFVCP